MRRRRDERQDAAVAAAAALNVTEPTSTGIGGDLFCLFYDASSKTIRGINASGRAPAALTLERVRHDLHLPPIAATATTTSSAGAATASAANSHPRFINSEGGEVQRIPMDNVHAVTVPGAAAGWVDVVEKLGSGKLGLAEVLADAVRLAEDGFPVSQLAARFWTECEPVLHAAGPNAHELLRAGQPPRTGQLMTMPGLARVLRALGDRGKPAVYEGPVAQSIVDAVRARGGLLSMADLSRHLELGSEEAAPIGRTYAGVKVWECAPNGQGLVALMALGILEALETAGRIPQLGGPEPGWGHNQTELSSPRAVYHHC